MRLGYMILPEKLLEKFEDDDDAAAADALSAGHAALAGMPAIG